ncbi:MULTISPECIES: integrase arm-type DNA-binding domain-containing protein [unclassified Sphingomonas]|uniref:tyrosine-type recombinase/integrase n=1 Tax=unclassified Sphingomonas TaxID=196159 RepID=UPI002269C2E3|nr:MULTISPECIES: integrase arm-type DNA-binding domain-containing protein [unclassified Sphingomonas]
MAKLSALAVKNAKAGRHGDGAGLYLLVSPAGAKSWVLRVQRDGKRRDIGLGSLASLSLAEARGKAPELRKHALNGRDPVAERDRDRRPIPTFKEAAKAAHEALKPGWSAKNAAAFLTSLETHVYPAIGNLKVDSIEASNIRDTLAAIWTKVPETARKVKVRINAVLDFAHSKGWRPTEAPRKSVSVGLSKQAKGGNFASMPWADVPAFVADLREKVSSTGRDALLLQILTAARTGEIRSARWANMDLERGDWNRPAELMKSREPHTVTLNTAAVALLERIVAARKPKPGDLVFPSAKGTMISDMTLSKVMRDAKQPYTPHGFRSSFRDWAAEQMHQIPDAVAEAALAHAVPDKVVRAYKGTRRSASRCRGAC